MLEFSALLFQSFFLVLKFIMDCKVLTTCVLIAIQFSFVLFGIASGQFRILNGKQAAEGRWPSLASIVFNNTLHFCGGTVLNKNVILTSAQCV